MLAEAFKFLTDMGRDSAKAVVKVDAEPSHVYFIRDSDGSLEKEYADPAPRLHRASSLAAIIDMADDGSEVWYSRDGVTLLCDKSTRRDVVSLPISLSPQLLKLIEWERARPSMSQKQLIRELRITFRDNLGLAGNIVEILRRVKFNAGQTVDSTIGHGKASVGKSIMGEVTGAGTIPEFISFDVPVFAQACFSTVRFPVECAIEPDAETAQFQVIPVTGAIERVVANGEKQIGVMLREEGLPEDVPAYYGAAK